MDLYHLLPIISNLNWRSQVGTVFNLKGSKPQTRAKPIPDILFKLNGTRTLNPNDIPNIISQHRHGRVSDGGSGWHVDASDQLPVPQVDEVSRGDAAADVGARLVADVGVAVDNLQAVVKKGRHHLKQSKSPKKML